MHQAGSEIMLRYFVEYPRGFANEYEVFAVEQADADRFRELIPAAEPITRREAIRLGWTRPRRAKKDGEQWYGGFRLEYPYHDDVDSAIKECVSATRQAMVNMLSPSYGY
jgi:hypothetical protein